MPKGTRTALGRTRRFRRDAQLLAETLGQQPSEFSAQPLAGLAQIAQAIGRDLTEADWWRLLDALLLIATHPHPTKPA
jgi:hypothetical protein